VRIPVLFVVVWLAAGTDPGGVRIEGPADRIGSEPMRAASEPPLAAVQYGDPAPDFSFMAHDGSWRRLSDLTSRGPVLLLLAPNESQLRALDRERDALGDLGVAPAAVIELRPHQARALTRRLGLRYTVVPDARRIVASQLNAIHPHTLGTVPSWFVIDGGRKVRGLRRGQRLERGFSAVAAQALDLPLPDATRPSGR
jgi:peroxiredoxin